MVSANHASNNSALVGNDNRHKQIGFRKTFVNKHWIKDEVFTAISLLSLRFFNLQRELLWGTTYCWHFDC